MKLFFISDIHGSLTWLKRALERFDESGAEQLVILGDELYHGARNPLPEGYDTKGAAALLNRYKDKIVAVRGNCDSEVDQMVLDYPVMSDYSVMLWQGKRLFLTHGHLFNEEQFPPLKPGDAFFFGHIHVPVAEVRNGVTVINPGSITFPKEGNPNSYGILEDGIFRILDFEGNVIK